MITASVLHCYRRIFWPLSSSKDGQHSLCYSTLHCLGDYKNGIWLTISSLLLWIDNMDIGLGNGLRNKIAEYIAHGEHERTRSLISSTFAMLTCIIIPVLFILLLLIAISDPYTVFNATPSKVGHLDQVLMVTVTLVCTSFIFKLIGNFYMGMQLPAVSNLLIALGQTLALIGTYIVLRRWHLSVPISCFIQEVIR